MVEEKLRQHTALRKIIVYSSSVVGAKETGEALGCEVYYYTVDSREGKAQRLQG